MSLYCSGYLRMDTMNLGIQESSGRKGVWGGGGGKLFIESFGCTPL